MRNQQATIRDLALKLRISISTVSRALRDAPEVNAETKRAVLEMAKVLNYEPNRVAQNLRTRKTNILGVVVPQINLHFFSSAISGIQEYATTRHYGVMICQSMESFATEQSTLHMLVSNRIDGLLISLSSETNTRSHLQALINKNIPIVLFDRVIEGLAASCVVVDDHDGAYKAVDYLIQSGCKRIVFMGGPRHLYISQQRLQGYKDAHRKNNLPIDETLIMHCRDLAKDPVTATRHLLDLTPRLDAFFCLNDPVAILAMEVLKTHHIRIPEEISVVGFTNEPVSQYIEPSLTTVSQPSYEMGQVAARLFIDQLEAEGPVIPQTKILPTTLIIRNSTRPLTGQRIKG